MELNLKRAQYDYYEAVHPTSMTCEVMREHIVPDSCADIARIVESVCQVCVTDREVSGDGRICAGGSVTVSVLYIPEKGSGPCVLRVQLPFQCCSDGQWSAEGEYPDIRAEIQSVDTRLLNPRKVLTKVNLVLYPTVCRRVARSICTDAVDSDKIELLRCERRTTVIAAVREKEFTFVDEIPLSQSRGGAEDILLCRAEMRGTDCRLIGTKLVLKGAASLAILYRASGGSIETHRAELPFSQILDGNTLQEDWNFETELRTLSLDCRIGAESGADDRHTLTLTMLLRARVTALREEEVCFIADLYGTEADITCTTEEIELKEDCRKYSKRINIREALDTGTAVKTVVDLEGGCGNARADKASQSVEIPIWVRCLYLDEHDALHGVRKEFTAQCQLEQDAQQQIESRAFCCGEIMAGILPDGIEVRFPVECVVEEGRVSTYLSVNGGEILEEREKKLMPSIILRKIGREERLWSVAKAYRTTCRAILEINELADEQQIPRDKLLLIPRRH